MSTITRLSVTGPRADALLLAGWRPLAAGPEREADAPPCAELERIPLDGDPVPPSGARRARRATCSAELDVFGRDRIYEQAVSAAR